MRPANRERPVVLAVIGQGWCDEATAALAEEVGREIARRGLVLVTGGLGGVMEAASRGARAEGGLVLGVLPGPDPADANEHVTVAIASGMGDARNAILANTAEAFVAVAGEHGTLSEIAYALKRGKRVAGLSTWPIEGVHSAETAREAVDWALGKDES